MDRGEDDKCKVTVFSCQSVGRRRKCCGKLRGRRGRRGEAGSVAIYRDEQNSKKDKGGTREAGGTRGEAGGTKEEEREGRGGGGRGQEIRGQAAQIKQKPSKATDVLWTAS